MDWKYLPERNGVFLNAGYMMQFPHDERLKMWEDEYQKARKILDQKGRNATREEYDRMCYSLQMWTREEAIGIQLPGDMEEDEKLRHQHNI